eukprot:1148742-Amphidinium_carterae.1
MRTWMCAGRFQNIIVADVHVHLRTIHIHTVLGVFTCLVSFVLLSIHVWAKCCVLVAPKTIYLRKGRVLHAPTWDVLMRKQQMQMNQFPC